VELIPWFKLQWDRVLGVGLMLVGGVLLVVGWVGASGEVYIANQLPYLLSGGLGGLARLGVGATLWLSADLSDEWRTLDRLERQGADSASLSADSTLADRVRELELLVSELTGDRSVSARHAQPDRVRS
jgi:hypothetical protein